MSELAKIGTEALTKYRQDVKNGIKKPKTGGATGRPEAIVQHCKSCCGVENKTLNFRINTTACSSFGCPLFNVRPTITNSVKQLELIESGITTNDNYDDDVTYAALQSIKSLEVKPLAAVAAFSKAEAVRAYCAHCISADDGLGKVRQRIKNCEITDCALYPVRCL